MVRYFPTKIQQTSKNHPSKSSQISSNKDWTCKWKACMVQDTRYMMKVCVPYDFRRASLHASPWSILHLEKSFSHNICTQQLFEKFSWWNITETSSNILRTFRLHHVPVSLYFYPSWKIVNMDHKMNPSSS